jgi:hypothetical protein
VDATVLQAEVARLREVITVVEEARSTIVLATEASAWEAAMAHDDATLHIIDTEDWVAVAEWEVLEQESQAEAEQSTALASTRTDTKGLARRITLLEGELAEERRAGETSERKHWACFEELTLL